MKTGRVIYEGKRHYVRPAEEAGKIRLDDGRILGERDVQWLTPYKVGTVFALAINYSEHAKEINAKSHSEDPVIFIKGHNALVAHHGRTRRPAGLTKFNYECELCVVIGKPARNVSEADAYKYVAGYTVGNDYAFRDFLEGYYRPNLRVKSRDSATALGPWFVDASDIADPMNLVLRTYVNGELKQEGKTSGMTNDIPRLIAFMSSFMTLQPGDTIMTGTPKGTTAVDPGDLVETEIEGIGRLANTVTADDDFPPVLWPGE